MDDPNQERGPDSVFAVAHHIMNDITGLIEVLTQQLEGNGVCLAQTTFKVVSADGDALNIIHRRQRETCGYTEGEAANGLPTMIMAACGGDIGVDNAVNDTLTIISNHQDTKKLRIGGKDNVAQVVADAANENVTKH